MANRSSSSRSAKPGRRPPPKRSNAGAIAIAVVVGVVLIVGAIVLLVVGGDGDDDADESPFPTTPLGTAICEPIASLGSEPTETASAGSVPASGAGLGPFAADDVLQPVAIEGPALPAFTSEIREGDPDIALCETAPVVSGYDYAGEEITIDPANDGPTMVVLLAHWCPHCNREIPVLNEWRDSGEIPDSLNIVGVSTGIDPDGDNYPPGEWLEAVDWQWPVLADSDAGADDPDDDVVTSAFRAYGGTTFPTMLLIGSDGRLLARFSGEVPADLIAASVDDFLAQDADSAV
jgi:cytochrome c biogenesis protein CcmG/thiol:disulfide interchange protein DsbE